MTAKDLAVRAGTFVRSVLPAEPAHWMILIGATLLYISANLPWWSGPGAAGEPVRWLFRQAAFIKLYLIAGAAAYYLSFVPTRKQRIFVPYFLVFVPAAAVLVQEIATALDWSRRGTGYVSTIDRMAGHVWQLKNLKILWASFDIGFFTAAVGLALVLIVFLLGRKGRATLPIRLAMPVAAPQETETDAAEHRRTMRFVWIMISLVSLPAALAHGFYNVFLAVPHGTPIWVLAVLWAACACVLFRFFPIDEPEPEVTSESGPTLEPGI